MSLKKYLAGLGAAATGTFGGPIAYHSRTLHFDPEDDTCFVTQEAGGPNVHVQNQIGEHAKVSLTPNEEGSLVGNGTVMGIQFSIAVDEKECTFTSPHGGDRLWLGRDMVHVQRVEVPDALTAEADF